MCLSCSFILPHPLWVTNFIKPDRLIVSSLFYSLLSLFNVGLFMSFLSCTLHQPHPHRNSLTEDSQLDWLGIRSQESCSRRDHLHGVVPLVLEPNTRYSELGGRNGDSAQELVHWVNDWGSSSPQAQSLFLVLPCHRQDLRYCQHSEHYLRTSLSHQWVCLELDLYLVLTQYTGSAEDCRENKRRQRLKDMQKKVHSLFSPYGKKKNLPIINSKIELLSFKTKIKVCLFVERP